MLFSRFRSWRFCTHYWWLCVFFVISWWEWWPWLTIATINKTPIFPCMRGIIIIFSHPTSLPDSLYFLNVTCTVAQIYESWLCLVIELFRIQNQIWALRIKAGSESVSFWEGVTNIAGGRIKISLYLHWQNLPILMFLLFWYKTHIFQRNVLLLLTQR